jgi:hypothetical protein
MSTRSILQRVRGSSSQFELKKSCGELSLLTEARVIAAKGLQNGASIARFLVMGLRAAPHVHTTENDWTRSEKPGRSVDNNSNHSHVLIRFSLLFDDRPSPRSFA